MERNAKEKAYDRLARHCAKMETCTEDARRKLQKTELSEEERQEIIERLQREGFIDDGRYARAFATDKVRFARWGRMKIRMALRGKGIGDELIENALGRIEGEDYKEALGVLLEPRLKESGKELEWTEYAKLMRFAQGRGFEHDVVEMWLDEAGYKGV